MFKDLLASDIEKGIKGQNIGIPTGFPNIDKNINGIQKSIYTIVGGNSGCLALDTNVIMFDGTMKKVQDVVVGDQLMGPDSKPRNVLELYRGDSIMYWVHQTNGMSYRVNIEHILSLVDRNDGCIKNISIQNIIYIDNGVVNNIKLNYNGYGYDMHTKSLIDKGRITLVRDKIDNYYGFELDGDHLFLLEDFTVTHNTGKTSYVDLAYVLNPYDWWLKNRETTNIKLKWVYRSMERNIKYKLAKWACLKLFRDYNIIMDVPTMLGWQGRKYVITDELKDKIFEAGAYFDTMFDSGVIDMIDGSANPTGIYNYLKKVALDNGEIIQINEFTRRYIPKDENLHIITINDHIGKLSNERNEGTYLTDKQLLDLHSHYMGLVRDRYGIAPIDISQFNRSIGSVSRMNAKDVSPEPDDFKGSGDMYENADVALGLFNPFKFKINNFMGYDINKFVGPGGENRFRSISIIKNSYGADDIIIGLNFLGENGMFREMPISDKFTMNPSYYDKAVKFE